MARGQSKKAAVNKEAGSGTSTNLGFEQELWATAHALRNNMDVAEYIRGIDAQIAHGDTFHNDRQADLKFDYMLTNSPFNDSDFRDEPLNNDRRWTERRNMTRGSEV